MTTAGAFRPSWTVCAGIILPLQIVTVSYLISIEHRLTVLESRHAAEHERGAARR